MTRRSPDLIARVTACAIAGLTTHRMIIMEHFAVLPTVFAVLLSIAAVLGGSFVLAASMERIPGVNEPGTPHPDDIARDETSHLAGLACRDLPRRPGAITPVERQVMPQVTFLTLTYTVNDVEKVYQIQLDRTQAAAYAGAVQEADGNVVEISVSIS